MSEDQDAGKEETRKPDKACVSFPALKKERYRPMVADMDITDEQADELLQIIWSIMCSFVELGFGSDSVQMIPERIFRQFLDAAENGVQSERSETTKMTDASGGADETRH